MTGKCLVSSLNRENRTRNGFSSCWIMLRSPCLNRSTGFSMKTPLITIIAGGPCTGKSTIARQLAAESGCDACLGDHVKLAYQYLVDPDDPEAKTNSYRAWLDFGYSRTPENIYRGALEHSRKFWPVLQHIMEHYSERGESLIVEGSFFLPEFFSRALSFTYRCIVCDPSETRHRLQAEGRNRRRRRNSEDSARHNSSTMFDSVRVIQQRLIAGFRSLAAEEGIAMTKMHRADAPK